MWRHHHEKAYITCWFWITCEILEYLVYVILFMTKESFYAKFVTLVSGPLERTLILQMTNQGVEWSRRKKYLHSELFWFTFSGIRTEYGQIFRISPYSVSMRGNADQNNSDYGHFSCSDPQYHYEPWKVSALSFPLFWLVFFLFPIKRWYLLVCCLTLSLFLKTLGRIDCFERTWWVLYILQSSHCTKNEIFH